MDRFCKALNIIAMEKSRLGIGVCRRALHYLARNHVFSGHIPDAKGGIRTYDNFANFMYNLRRQHFIRINKKKPRMSGYRQPAVPHRGKTGGRPWPEGSRLLREDRGCVSEKNMNGDD